MRPVDTNRWVRLITRDDRKQVDVLRVLERKPLPSVESMIHVQRLVKAQNPKIGAVNLDELNGTPLIKKLDGSGLSISRSRHRVESRKDLYGASGIHLARFRMNSG